MRKMSASLTFEAVLTNRLLARWMMNQSARLRHASLLGRAQRHIQSSPRESRTRANSERTRRVGLTRRFHPESAASEQLDIFYAAWVADLLEQTVDSLLDELHRAGKGDYFRVLYSRICEEMSMPEIAEALSIPLTSVENYFKAARNSWQPRWKHGSGPTSAAMHPKLTSQQDFDDEWRQLGEYLATHGGLDDVLRRSTAGHSIFSQQRRKTALISSTLSRIHVSSPEKIGKG